MREAGIKVDYIVQLGMKKENSIHKDKACCKRHQKPEQTMYNTNANLLEMSLDI